MPRFVGVLLALAIVIGVAISAGYFVYDSFKSLQVLTSYA